VILVLICFDVYACLSGSSMLGLRNQLLLDFTTQLLNTNHFTKLKPEFKRGDFFSEKLDF
jgi:hypothetical protein